MSEWREGLGDAKFEALHAAYEASLPAKLRQIESLARQMREANDDSLKDAAGDLSRAAHRLAGSAGIFGFPALCEAARRLEDFTTELLLRKGLPHRGHLRALDDILSRMHEAASPR
jgi:HPt (histidine-containing phosphotransfer) domain-containing protein